jgi:hypothetical protein
VRSLVLAVPPCAALVLSVGLARAVPRDPVSYALAYDAPVGCPSEETFRADVARHVSDESHAEAVRLNITLEEQETGYLGILVAFDESGNASSRRIQGKTCVDVAHAVAFLAGLVIDLGGRLEPEVPPNVAPSLTPRAAQPAPAPAAPHSVDVSTVLLLGIRGGLGPVARPTGMAGVEIGARTGILAPSVRLSAFVSEGDFAGTAGGAALWMVGGRLELCVMRFGNAQVSLRPCVGGEIGLVHSRGQSTVDPRTTLEPWASVAASLRLQWYATKAFFAELGGGPVFPVIRAQYYFEPDQTLYAVPWLTAEGAGGIGLRF